MNFGSIENEKPAAPVTQEVTIDSTWPRQYYMSADAKERRALLDAALIKQVSPQEDELRLELWKLRYPAKGGEAGMQMDAYLRAWMSFRYISNSKNTFFKGRLKKELRKTLEGIGYYKMQEKGELAKDILFDEIKHTAVLYMQLCTKDKAYGSLIWGFGNLKDDQLYNKIAKDVYEVAYQAAINADMTEECELWTKAITKAYYESFPNYENLLDAEIAKRRETV